MNMAGKLKREGHAIAGAGTSPRCWPASIADPPIAAD